MIANEKTLKELKCGLVSKQDLTEFQVSTAIQTFLKICIVDVFKILEKETSFKLKYIKYLEDQSLLNTVYIFYIFKQFYLILIIFV